MKEEILTIAEQEGLTISEVLTILKLAFVIDKENNLNIKYEGKPLDKVWKEIPDKKYWLEVHKAGQKKKKMKR